VEDGSFVSCLILAGFHSFVGFVAEEVASLDEEGKHLLEFLGMFLD